MKQARINIRSVANTAHARKEKRNGRDVLIVPSATLPDDVVMNGILYPAAEIERSYTTLNRTPAPLGHPTINGQFVSAKDPEGINIGYVGAWNENARREGGRVLLDKVIDVEVANRSEGGKRVLAAIEAGDAIHTSTGLLCMLHDNPDTDKTAPRYVARDMEFDHDAILLDEPGAATPDQGVGMLVNGQQIDVVNSVLEWADRDLDWGLLSVLDSVERRRKAGFVEKLKALILKALGDEPQPATEEEDMAINDEQFKGLETQVNALDAKIGALPTADALAALVKNAVDEAMKPVAALATQVEALSNSAKATEDAERAALVQRVINAKTLSEASAKALPTEALRELANTFAPVAAPLIAGGVLANGGKSDFEGYSLNAELDKDKKAA